MSLIKLEYSSRIDKDNLIKPYDYIRLGEITSLGTLYGKQMNLSLSFFNASDSIYDKIFAPIINVIALYEKSKSSNFNDIDLIKYKGITVGFFSIKKENLLEVKSSITMSSVIDSDKIVIMLNKQLNENTINEIIESISSSYLRPNTRYNSIFAYIKPEIVFVDMELYSRNMYYHIGKKFSSIEHIENEQKLIAERMKQFLLTGFTFPFSTIDVKELSDIVLSHGSKVYSLSPTTIKDYATRLYNTEMYNTCINPVYRILIDSVFSEIFKKCKCAKPHNCRYEFTYL